MGDATEQNIYNASWNDAWIATHTSRHAKPSAEFWDMRAKSFSRRAVSPYAKNVLALMDVQPGESVADIGCGSGTLAVPLAAQGHPVIAIDFSHRMLEEMAARIECEQVEGITAVQAAWEDDWAEAGIGPADPATGLVTDVVDVAVASRSIAVGDLGAALRKMHAIARRRACVIITADVSPRVDMAVHTAIGRHVPRITDAVFCMNVLFQAGQLPSLSYIPSAKREVFASGEAAIEDARNRMRNLTPEEDELLVRFFDEHLVDTMDEEGNPAVAKDYERITNWAFVAWDTSRPFEL